MRLVRGLISAKALDARPAVIPIGRPRAAAKIAGLRYEREVAKMLGLLGAVHGRWFEYWDSAGRGFCQPDLVLPWRGKLVVFECKYTWTPVAHTQLDSLYLPVVAKALGKPVLGAVICKKLLPETADRSICVDVHRAIALAESGASPVLHWIGVGALAA